MAWNGQSLPKDWDRCWRCSVGRPPDALTKAGLCKDCHETLQDPDFVRKVPVYKPNDGPPPKPPPPEKNLPPRS